MLSEASDKMSPLALQDIRTDFGRIDCSTFIEDAVVESVSDTQMVLDAFTFAVRSILPLNVFLILMIKLVLRQNLPKTSFEVPPPMALLEDLDFEFASGIVDSDVELGDFSAHGTNSPMVAGSSTSKWVNIDDTMDAEARKRRGSMVTKIEEYAQVKESKEAMRERKRERLTNAIAAVGGADDEKKVMRREATKELSMSKLDLSSRGSGEGTQGLCASIYNQLPLIGGVFESMAGMTLFNIGLTYGFTALGDQSGLLLPAAFLETKEVCV